MVTVTPNNILLFVGIMVTLIGATSLIAPNVARIISAPGNARIKAAIAIVVGLILVFISLFIKIPSG